MAGRRGVRIARIIMSTGLVAAALVVTGGTVGAHHEPWGWSEFPSSVPAGELIHFRSLSPLTGLPTDFGPRALAIMASEEACATSTPLRIELLDARGQQVAAFGPGRPPIAPPELVGGTFFYRMACTPNGHPVRACARVQITAPGTTRGDPRLQVRDTCPVSLASTMTSLFFDVTANIGAVLGGGFTIGGVPTGPIPRGEPVTTTTRPGAPAPSGAGGDRTPPVISGLNADDLGYCNGVPVQANVTDNVGVASVFLEWNGTPGSGSMFMNDYDPLYSATITGLADAGELTITVSAADAAGNIGSAATTLEVSLC